MIKGAKGKDNQLNEQSIANADKLLRWFARIFGITSNLDPATEGWVTMVKTWATGLGTLSQQELREGCEWCKNNNEQYAPSLARFRHHAKGLPDTDVAFIEAFNNRFSHGAVYETMRRIGTSFWKRTTTDNAERKFSSMYGKVCVEIMEGTLKFPETEPLRQKPKDTGKVASKETAQYYTRKIDAMLRGKINAKKKALDNIS